MSDLDAPSSSSHVSTSSAYTTAPDGDYWKARGDVCEECGRPWKRAVWCRLCQACRDSEVHLKRVQGQLRIRPPKATSPQPAAPKAMAPPGYVVSQLAAHDGNVPHSFDLLVNGVNEVMASSLLMSRTA